MAEEQKKESIKLNKPTDVICTEATENTLIISWKAVEHATDYIILCKDVLSDSWETCESAMSSGETTVTIENLYPTATFEVKVIAASNNLEYCNSDDSDIIYCDTAVGSCAPKEKKCCF